MAGYSTAWIIGSTKSVAYDITLDGNTESVAGDALYLYHPTDALSLLAQVEAAMTAAGVPDASAALTKNRRVKLSSSAGFSLAWPDADLRDLLGFTVGGVGATQYIATNPSPLLWSPAKPLRPEKSPVGIAGLTQPLSYFVTSPTDGSTFVVTHGERVDQTYSCDNVAIDRVLTTSGLGGEWATFFAECAAKGWSFYVYPSVTEESGSTSAATLSGGLGPYAYQPRGRAASWTYRRSRGFEWCDNRADIDFACRVVPEYG